MVEYHAKVERARRADLYKFLETHHSQDIVREGRYLRLKQEHSIVIKEGHSGYTKYNEDFATGHGNGIDLLTTYLDYTPRDAICALSEADFVSSCVEERASVSLLVPDRMKLPSRNNNVRNVFAYLSKTRGLSCETVNALIEADLIYQDQVHNNAVFINRDKDYCEIRGTCSYIKPFHGSRRADPSSYWSFQVRHGDIEEVFICEAAIDAMSLYELHRRSHSICKPTKYCSIGGVGNQTAIDRIVTEHTCSVIIAVDNDAAGQMCIARNPHLPYTIPTKKDWNEDLLHS